MGKKNRTFTFKGIVVNVVELTFIENLLNQTGSVVFTSNSIRSDADFSPEDFFEEDFETHGFDTYIMFSSNVFFHDLGWKDSGLRPLEKEFVLSAMELPPELGLIVGPVETYYGFEKISDLLKFEDGFERYDY